MNNQKKVGVAAIVFLFTFAGCNKITNWATNNFKQADQYAKKYAQPVQDYFRSTSSYNFLTLVGDFTALLLSGDVRKSYVDYYAHRYSLDSDEKELLFYRLMDENKHYISFYLVGDGPVAIYSSGRAFFTGGYNKQGAVLGTKDSVWKIYLRIDGKEFLPHHVKLTTLPVEYKYFFGDKMSQFKKAFTVLFDVSLDNKPHDISLVLRSGEHEVDLLWEKIVY